MKKISLFHIFLAILLFGAASSAVCAQETFREEENQPPARNVNLLRELNLTNAQIRRIREINRQRQPVNRAARERLQNANRALDEAIYADTLNDEEIQTRLREAQAAQAEVVKNRIATETAIRQTLSPAQLVRFRELRTEYGKRLENRRNPNQTPRRNLPLRRLGNRRRAPQ